MSPSVPLYDLAPTMDERALIDQFVEDGATSGFRGRVLITGDILCVIPDNHDMVKHESQVVGGAILDVFFLAERVENELFMVTDTYDQTIEERIKKKSKEYTSNLKLDSKSWLWFYLKKRVRENNKMYYMMNRTFNQRKNGIEALRMFPIYNSSAINELVVVLDYMIRKRRMLSESGTLQVGLDDYYGKPMTKLTVDQIQKSMCEYMHTLITIRERVLNMKNRRMIRELTYVGDKSVNFFNHGKQVKFTKGQVSGVLEILNELKDLNRRVDTALEIAEKINRQHEGSK